MSTHLELTGGKHLSSSVLVQTTLAFLMVFPMPCSQEIKYLKVNHLQKVITGDQHLT